MTLKVDQFTKNWRPKIEALLAHSPDAGIAEWTGLGVQKALKSKRDGKEYSCTALVKQLLAEVGVEADTIPGPDYWLLPNGRSMYEESKVIEKRLATVEADSVTQLATLSRCRETRALSESGQRAHESADLLVEGRQTRSQWNRGAT